MTTSRRDFLKVSGITLAAAASSGLWRAAGQASGPAYTAWEDWQVGRGESPLALVRAGILAASPHNSQPWLFRVSSSSVEVFADSTRCLGAIDPFQHELYLGLGCCLANMVEAAGANGYVSHLTLFPQPQDDLACIARLDLAPGNIPLSDLYSAIPLRRTNRGLYDSRPVQPALLESMERLNHSSSSLKVFWFCDEADRGEAGGLLIQAEQAYHADPEQSQDSRRWTRQSWMDIQKYRDGIPPDIPGFPPVRAIGGLIPAFSLSLAGQPSLKSQVESAPVHGVLAVQDPADKRQLLQAGMLWQRIHLFATQQKLAMQPLNQAIERAGREAELEIEAKFGSALQTLLGSRAWHPVLQFRLGYPTTQAPPSPRRSLESVILKHQMNLASDNSKPAQAG
jgi:hypothetical protein